MKKALLSLTVLLVSSAVVHAQWTPSGSDIYYNNTTGNVGVGTTTPAVRMHLSTIMNPGVATELLRLEVRGNGGNELGGEGASINFYTPMSPSPDLLGAQIYSFRENGINASPTTALRFATNNSGTTMDRLVISGTGNVGIGTTDNSNWNLAGSTYKLAVGGSIIATSVTVKAVANWPDYVLKKGYQLPPLTAIKNYIDQNQHLPEIPSAQEIAKEGQNLGEINQLLLKKVEELTLYAIENERKDKEKDKLLASLQEQINALKQQLNKHSRATKH